MASIDRIKALAPIVVANTDPDNNRKRTQAENNKRTERYQLRVTGQVDITVAGTGVRNRGSILGALSDIGYIDGGADKLTVDARLARFYAECMSPSALPATRLGGPGIQAATLLSEVVPLWMCSPRSISPNYTKYVEPNKQLQQEVFVTPMRQILRLAGGPALVGTVTGMQVTVEQLYDDLVGVKPWLQPYYRQISVDVPGANAGLKIDLRGNRYIRFIGLQQDSDAGEVNDIVNNLVLRGDNRAIIGDRAVSFRDLQEHAQEEFGGAVVFGGYWGYDFTRYGRLTSLWNPFQDTNLRLELDVQPSVTPGATSSKVRILVVEYEQTAMTENPLPIAI